MGCFKGKGEKTGHIESSSKYNVKALYWHHQAKRFVSEKHDVDDIEKIVNIVAELIKRVEPYQVLITDLEQKTPPGMKKVK